MPALNLRSLIRAGALLALVITVAAPVPAQRTYIGAEACGGCHEDHLKWSLGGVHQQAAVPQGAAEGQKGCETCHGPGSEHAEAPAAANIITFRLEEAGLRSAQCLTCHASLTPTLNFRRADHDTAKVACDQCHKGPNSQSFHRMRAVSDTMSRAEPGLCYKCHPAQRADFVLPFRHPVTEGHIRCSSCHPPHGGFTLRQLRTRGAGQICRSCHEDKQGPFVFEHPAVRSTGCQACHKPHGGTNPKMLTRAEIRSLCLECHTNTPASHDLSQARYGDCTACHVRIHGSNLNRLLLE